jgi:hypothetical protein
MTVRFAEIIRKVRRRLSGLVGLSSSQGPALPTVICRCYTMAEVEACLRLCAARNITSTVVVTDRWSDCAPDENLEISIGQLETGLMFADQMVVQWRIRKTSRSTVTR